MGTAVSVDLSRSESILVRGHILAGGARASPLPDDPSPLRSQTPTAAMPPPRDRMTRPSSCRNKEAGSTVPVGLSRQRSTSVVTMFAQKLRLQVGDLSVVQVRHRKMGVPENPDVRRVGEVRMAAHGIDQVHKLLHHDPPLPDLDIRSATSTCRVSKRRTGQNHRKFWAS